MAVTSCPSFSRNAAILNSALSSSRNLMHCVGWRESLFLAVARAQTRTLDMLLHLPRSDEDSLGRDRRDQGSRQASPAPVRQEFGCLPQPVFRSGCQGLE